jgi:hypothetical protein
MSIRMRTAVILALVLLVGSPMLAQDTSASSPATPPTENYSGMYTFLQDGEFVQITIEDAGRVTGFVSRYGDGESDRGVFLDQFFKEGKLDGKKLAFTTQTVHAVWFEFTGTVDRGTGKTPGDDGYHILKGTLTEFRTDAAKKVSSKSRDVTFKSFPQNLEATPPHGKSD